MIPSAKSPWFTAWFSGRAHARLRSRFGSLELAGRGHLEAALRRGPVLAVSNHGAWWDPLVVLVLAHRMMSADLYAMMDADNLRRLPFFAKVGAFGVQRGSRRDGAEAIRHAEGLLDRPGRLVWIFPQGQERPEHERPLRFEGGAARVAVRNPTVAVLPVGLSYAFGEREAPSIWVAVGEPLPVEPDARRMRAMQAEAVVEQLERVRRERSRPGTEGFESYPLSRPGWWGQLAERALAGLVRPFVPGLERLPPDADTRSLPPANDG